MLNRQQLKSAEIVWEKIFQRTDLVDKSKDH